MSNGLWIGRRSDALNAAKLRLSASTGQGLLRLESDPGGRSLGADINSSPLLKGPGGVQKICEPRRLRPPPLIFVSGRGLGTFAEKCSRACPIDRRKCYSKQPPADDEGARTGPDHDRSQRS